MKRSLVVVSLVSLVFAGVASAEVKKGDVLLDFLAGWTQENFADPPEGPGGDISVLFAAVRPGIAVTDNIRVAGMAAVADIDISDDFGDTDTTVWAIGASAEYVFMPANMLNLYIGGQVAWASADVDGVGDSVDGVLWGPRAGLLYTLNRANNLFVEYQYQLWAGDIGDLLDDGHMVLLGIEHKFVVGQ